MKPPPIRQRQVLLQTVPGRVDFLVRGERFASWRHQPGMHNGFSAFTLQDERSLTSPAPNGLAFWIGHPDVNGVNCSGMPGANGTIAALRTEARRGIYSVGILQECAWISPAGETLLRDLRRFRVAAGNCEGAVLDVTLRLIPPQGKTVVFGSNPHDILQLQLAHALVHPELGQVRNRHGDSSGDVHRKSSPWLAAAGVVQEETIGLAWLDHPQNPFYPTDWNFTSDGRLSPAPLLWAGMPGELRTPLTLRYRILAYMGYMETGWLEARYAEFLREPANENFGDPI